MNRATKKLLTIMIFCFCLFIVISVLSSHNRLHTIDESMYALINMDDSGFIYRMLDALAIIGSGEVIILLTLFIGLLLFIKKRWMQLVFLLTAVFGGIALNFLLKLVFRRERPGETTLLEVFGYSLEINSYSFPSGHTMRVIILFSFLIFLSLTYIGKKQWRIFCTVLFIIIPVLISLSRVITGAHYFTDIFAAALISIVWFLLCYIFFQYIRKKSLSPK